MSSEPNLTVFIIARDKFSTLPGAIGYMLADYSLDHHLDLCILDNGYPKDILDKSFLLCDEKHVSCRTITFDRYANTNAILNTLLQKEAGDGIFLLIENDCLFRSSEIRDLYTAMNVTGHAYCSPCILNCDYSNHFRPVRSTIDYSSNSVRFSLDRGRAVDYFPRPPSGTLTALDIVERHCLLINPTLLRQIGKLDEEMLDRTDIDLSIHLKSCGHTSAVHFGLAAFFMNCPNMKWDREYLSYRWNIDAVAASHRRLLEKWNIHGYKNTITHAYEIRECFLGESQTVLDCFGNSV